MKEPFMHTFREPCWCEPEERLIGETVVRVHRIVEEQPKQMELDL